MMFLNSLNVNRKKDKSETIICNVPFYSQRVGPNDFLKEGFKDSTYAQYWSSRICGLACMRMILGKFVPDLSINLNDLLELGLKIGAYNEKGGWIHSGLIKIASNFGLKGKRERIGIKINKIQKHLQKNRLVMASVTVGFMGGGKITEGDGSVYIMSKGGHLVVIFGCFSKGGKVEKLVLHHPSSESSYDWRGKVVTAEEFIRSFSGNIIYFYK